MRSWQLRDHAKNFQNHDDSFPEHPPTRHVISNTRKVAVLSMPAINRHLSQSWNELAAPISSRSSKVSSTTDKRDLAAGTYIRRGSRETKASTPRYTCLAILLNQRYLRYSLRSSAISLLAPRMLSRPDRSTKSLL